MTCQVPRSTLAACTRTKTSSAPIAGLSISSTQRTSSGAGPYSSCTIAVIVFPAAGVEGGAIAWSSGAGVIGILQAVEHVRRTFYEYASANRYNLAIVRSRHVIERRLTPAGVDRLLVLVDDQTSPLEQSRRANRRSSARRPLARSRVAGSRAVATSQNSLRLAGLLPAAVTARSPVRRSWRRSPRFRASG